MLQFHPRRRQVLLDDARYVLGCNARVAHVVGVDEDDGALVVAAAADVSKHSRGLESAALYLGPKRLEELASAFRAAPSLAWRGAHENLS